MKWLLITILLMLSGVTAHARTLIVATDSTGQYSRVGLAAVDAVAGDSILVRDGVYLDAPISIDSGVVVFAEHPGFAAIGCGGFPVSGIVLHQTAQLLGLGILGDPTSTHQELLEIQGGPATIYNCSFEPASNWGMMMKFFCNGRAPSIRQCHFNMFGTGSQVVQNFDTTTIWMPDNFFGTLDTVIIHRAILDSSNIVGGSGHVYISPVLDRFQWLEAQERPLYTPLTFQLTAYPNPFNPTTELHFSLPQTTRAQLLIYDLQGRLVCTLMDRISEAGPHSISFAGTGLSSGTYFARLTSPSQSATQKLLLLK
jgi:hypothetical protein